MLFELTWVALIIGSAQAADDPYRIIETYAMINGQSVPDCVFSNPPQNTHMCCDKSAYLDADAIAKTSFGQACEALPNGGIIAYSASPTCGFTHQGKKVQGLKWGCSNEELVTACHVSPAGPPVVPKKNTAEISKVLKAARSSTPAPSTKAAKARALAAQKRALASSKTAGAIPDAAKKMLAADPLRAADASGCAYQKTQSFMTNDGKETSAYVFCCISAGNLRSNDPTLDIKKRNPTASFDPVCNNVPGFHTEIYGNYRDSSDQQIHTLDEPNCSLTAAQVPSSHRDYLTYDWLKPANSSTGSPATWESPNGSLGGQVKFCVKESEP